MKNTFKNIFVPGFMYFPSTWNHLTETFTELGPKQGPPGLHLPIPEVHCDESTGLQCSVGGKNQGSATEWWTNNTFNSNPTLPSEFYDQENVKWRKPFHPWGSPGSAPTWGEGCDANMMESLIHILMEHAALDLQIW